MNAAEETRQLCSKADVAITKEEKEEWLIICTNKTWTRVVIDSSASLSRSISSIGISHPLPAYRTSPDSHPWILSVNVTADGWDFFVVRL